MAERRLGIKHPLPVEQGWNEDGEHTSNPLAGPPFMESYGTGGLKRPVLESLHDFEHNWGADKARRSFNRGVPHDCEE